MRRAPTWVWEQGLLFALVLNAAAWQIALLGGLGALSARDAFLIAASAASLMAAQKVRSMADRQAEANEAKGVEHASMTCAPFVAHWSFVAQLFGLFLSVATAPSWAHLLVAAYVAGYGPIWRKRIYRAAKPIERCVVPGCRDAGPIDRWVLGCGLTSCERHADDFMASSESDWRKWLARFQSRSGT